MSTNSPQGNINTLSEFAAAHWNAFRESYPRIAACVALSIAVLLLIDLALVYKRFEYGRELTLLRDSIAERVLQERLVGRVFEQPANQIGHTRDQITEGCVDAKRAAHVDDSGLQRIAHAEQHLQLEVARCQADRLGVADRRGQAADVVTGQRRANDAVMVEQPSVLDDMADGKPDRITGPMVNTAAEQGDLVAHRAFASVGHWLGIGVANLVAALDPEVVVVGGGVSAAGDRLLQPARDALGRTLVGAEHRRVPGLVAAELGPRAGMIGAALLVS